MQGKAIYRNGQYTVMPLTIQLVVRDREGREMYRTNDIEDAIDATDDMASLDERQIAA